MLPPVLRRSMDGGGVVTGAGVPRSWLAGGKAAAGQPATYESWRILGGPAAIPAALRRFLGRSGSQALCRVPIRDAR